MANATLVLIALCTGFLLPALGHIALAFVVVQNGATCRIEQALLEHVEPLHVHLLEDEFGVVPRRHVHHVLVRDWDGDWPAGPAHELRHVQVPAQVLMHDVLLQEAQIEHRLVILAQLLKLLQLLVVGSEALVIASAFFEDMHRRKLLLHCQIVLLVPFTVSFAASACSRLWIACNFRLACVYSAAVLVKIVAVECLSDVKTSLLRQAFGGFLDRSPVKNLVRFQIVGQHLLELVVDLLVKV